MRSHSQCRRTQFEKNNQLAGRNSWRVTLFRCVPILCVSCSKASNRHSPLTEEDSMKRLWCVLLLSSIGIDQTVTGGLDGHVTDSDGGAITNAQVVARDPSAGVERTTRTNDAGYFSMPFIPIGTYDVTVSMKGFANLVSTGNTVTLNKTTTLKLVLQVSAVQESVTVNEQAQFIDVASGEIRRGFDNVM